MARTPHWLGPMARQRQASRWIHVHPQHRRGMARGAFAGFRGRG
jgi:hypothetical protein